MANDGYDHDEMEMRSLAFEAAKLASMARSIGVLTEWMKLEQECPSFSTDYPKITELVHGSLELLNPDSFGNKMLFGNPLLKLAIISQPPQPPIKNEKEKKDDEGTAEQT